MEMKLISLIERKWSDRQLREKNGTKDLEVRVEHIGEGMRAYKYQLRQTDAIEMLLDSHSD